MAIVYPAKRYLHLHASELGKLLKGVPGAKVRPIRLWFDDTTRTWRITEEGRNHLQYLEDFSMVLEIAREDVRGEQPLALAIRTKPTFSVESLGYIAEDMKVPKFPRLGSGRTPLQLPTG